MEKNNLNGRESGADVEAVHRISTLLETGLSKRVLTVLLMLLEQGYSAESLVISFFTYLLSHLFTLFH